MNIYGYQPVRALQIIDSAVIVVVIKNRAINRKNHLLAQQISVAVNYKKMYWEKKRTEAPVETPQETELTDEQLFQHIRGHLHNHV